MCLQAEKFRTVFKAGYEKWMQYKMRMAVRRVSAHFRAAQKRASAKTQAGASVGGPPLKQQQADMADDMEAASDAYDPAPELDIGESDEEHEDTALLATSDDEQKQVTPEELWCLLAQDADEISLEDFEQLFKMLDLHMTTSQREQLFACARPLPPNSRRRCACACITLTIVRDCASLGGRRGHERQRQDLSS